MRCLGEKETSAEKDTLRGKKSVNVEYSLRGLKGSKGSMINTNTV